MVAAQMMWTFKRRPELKVPVLGWGVFLQGVGFVVAGAGADACAAYGQGSTGGVLLLYLGFTLFVGVAEGLLELIVRELSARRDDGMARATRCRRGARLNSAPSPRSAHK